jgi:hypothetical protein
MNTTFQTTTIGDFLDNFAGRRDMAGYDDSKPIKIAECNRDFVWPLDMQKALIRSILQGYPIPAMCVCNEQIVDGGNRSTTLWLYRNNRFSVNMSDNGEDMYYDEMCEDRAYTRRWDSAVIPQQIITNATPDQFAQIYENLNKGIPLTFGQLLENRKHHSWVSMAAAIINKSPLYPDGELVRQVWSPQFRKTKNRTELGFVFQVLVGAEKGPANFHTKFLNHLPLIMGNTVPTTDGLRKILEMLILCDEDRVVSAKKKSEVFRKFIGPIIHDMYTLSKQEWKNKWIEFIPKAYNTITKEQFKEITKTGNKRANISSMIEGVSERVQMFLNGELNVSASDSFSETSSDEED